jgi:hypothetical protein
MTSLEINKNKEYIAGYYKISQIALDNSGIIYGGMIRDEIRREHATEQFHKKFSTDNKFWDETFSIETLDRLFISNDIDIHFSDMYKANKFNNELEKDHGFKIDETPDSTLYLFDSTVIHKKFRANCIIGETFTMNGTKMHFNIDVCICRNMEPPYFNPDTELSILVNDGNSIRISTGCDIINHMNSFQKTRYCSRLIEKIIEKKNSIVQNPRDSTSAFVLLKRIGKMTRDDITFTNIDWIEYETTWNNDVCCLCRCADEDEHRGRLPIKIAGANLFHRECFCELTENMKDEHMSFDRESETWFFTDLVSNKCFMKF